MSPLFTFQTDEWYANGSENPWMLTVTNQDDELVGDFAYPTEQERNWALARLQERSE